MGLLSRLLGGALRAETPGPTHDFWYGPVGTLTPAGVRVDAEAAKRLSAWFRGRDILATVLAMLPLPLLERLPDNGGARPATGHPVYDLIHDKPNGWQDSFQWRRMLMYHLIDYGNAYNRIVPGARGVVDQLWPIPPAWVTPEQSPSTGRLRYHIRKPTSNQVVTLLSEEMFHLRGASDDGIVGKGILEYARTSLGTATATESYAANIFSRGALNGGVIEHPGLLNDEASKRMARTFATAVTDWHLPKVLEQGSVWKPNELTPEDAQMLLSRKYTVDDIARWLGVPRQMLENNDPSFGNAEQFDRSFVAYSLGPWLSLFEFGINDQLVMASRKYYAQFTREALVRGDLTARWNAHVAAVNAGIKTVDEVRAVENLNARGGAADELRQPQNITGKPATPVASDADDPDDPPPPPPPSRPMEEPDEDEAHVHATLIAVASAARLLRKEVAAVQRLAVRHAGDEDDFVKAITAFYMKHVDLVAATLQMPQAEASTYCAGQAHQVVNGDWVAALTRWRTEDYAAGVAAWAMEEVTA